MLNVNNKFRNYVQKEKYKPFKKLIKHDYDEMKTDVNHVVEVVTKATRDLQNNVNTCVRKATADLRNNPDKGKSPDKNVEQLIRDAHYE